MINFWITSIFIIISFLIQITSSRHECFPSAIVNLVQDWNTLHIFVEFDSTLLAEGKEFISENCWNPVLENYLIEIEELRRLGNSVSVDISRKHVNISKFLGKSTAILYPMPSRDAEKIAGSIRKLLTRLKSKKLDPVYLFIHLEMVIADHETFARTLGPIGLRFLGQIFFISHGRVYLACSSWDGSISVIPLFDKNLKNKYDEDEIWELWINHNHRREETA